MAERLPAREAIALVTHEFTQLPPPVRSYAPDGPLSWQGYDASRARAAERTGEEESVVCGRASVGGTAAVLIAFEFGFLGGSLGERTGDRLESAHAYAREHRLPVVSLVATGGSRMQEGMLALTQLQRVARQSALTRAAGLPQLAVLRDPTTGGGWATLGAGADVVLALPGAQVGFAGSRVRPPDANPAAYTAEAQWAAGAVDAVVRPEELRETLGVWLALLTGRSSEPAPVPRAMAASSSAHEPGPVSGAAVHEPGPASGAAAHEPGPASGAAAHEPGPASGAAAHEPGPASGAAAHEPGPAAHAPEPATASPAAPRPPEIPSTAADAPGLPTTGWEAVQRARSPQRPRAHAYLDAYFSRRTAISGDRAGGTDPDGMLCGFGEHAGRTIAYAAQTGAATRPAGYRTATRLIRLADQLGIPVLTLVDTPGAANDADAERQGVGAAIAELFGAVATARTPITTLVVGEGGSGGALALAAPGNTWATPDSYFSVIAPELAAAILKRPPEEAPATADQLRLRPQDLVALGVVRGIAAATSHRPPG